MKKAKTEVHAEARRRGEDNNAPLLPLRASAPPREKKSVWETRTLDQISTNLDSRRVPITKGVREGGQYPYYGASGVVDYVADYIFDGDALLVSEDGANLLARSTPIAFPASGKYWVNNHAHILKFDDMATQRFVEHFLESIPLDEYITGAAQPKLNQRALNSIPIPVPPLSEQQRIVGILDEAFEGIATAKTNAEKNLKNARALFQAGLSSACVGTLTAKWRCSHPNAEPGSAAVPRILRERRYRWEQQRLTGYESKGIEPPKGWREKYEAAVAADKRYLPTLPDTWAVISISAATHRLTYGITVRPKYVEDGVPIISGREIRSGEIDLNIANRISQHDYNGLREKCRLQLNDVLFGKTGTIGSVARVKIETPLCVSQNVALLSPIIQPEYFELVMRWGVIQTMAKDAIINAAIPDLQLRFLETFPVPIPPEEEQSVIVRKFHVLREETQRLATIYERKLAALDDLKKSLLHQAFSGEL